MLTRVPKEIPDLAGGINTGIHCTNLRDNEFASMLNYFVYGDSIYGRLPHRKLTTAVTDGGRVLAPYVDAYGDYKLVSVGNKVQAIQLNTSPGYPYTVVDYPLRYGTAIAPATKPFVYQGKNNILYILDPLSGGLWRASVNYYEKSGIELPVYPATITLPAVAVNASGVMTAANYRVAVTGYNSTTGDESDYIESAIIALSANNSINVTLIPVYPEPQVDIVRVWVTPPDQTNRYLLAGTVANGTTSFHINLAVADLGEILSQTNNVPPTGLKAGCIFDNSHFVSDGKLLYKSKYLQYETFDVDNDVQPIADDDGQKCIVLHKWENRLVAGKTNCLVHFIPTGSGDYIPTRFSEKTGVRSPHALKSKDSMLFGYDGEKFFRSISGGALEDISNLRIKDYLDNIPDNKRDDLVADIVSVYDSYIVTLPQTSDSVQLMYNYRTNSWAPLSTRYNPKFISYGYDAYGNKVLYGLSDDDYILKLFDATVLSTNNGMEDNVGISYSWKSKGFKATEISNIQTFLRSFAVLCTNRNITSTINVYENGVLLFTVTDFNLSDSYNDWKATGVATLGRSSGASYLQLEINILGNIGEDFNFSKLSLELVSGGYLMRQNNSI